MYRQMRRRRRHDTKFSPKGQINQYSTFIICTQNQHRLLHLSTLWFPAASATLCFAQNKISWRMYLLSHYTFKDRYNYKSYCILGGFPEIINVQIVILWRYPCPQPPKKWITAVKNAEKWILPPPGKVSWKQWSFRPHPFDPLNSISGFLEKLPATATPRGTCRWESRKWRRPQGCLCSNTIQVFGVER